ncbi:type II secretion protein F [Pigmentiphaga sp. NML080357]|uniref:type II secretion system F family protein n=1 Tax=Pigmentiphaga sp. NML080357 TaxID=2008675 RepID=UPI000B4203A3|nr:type II secretion system F family protein [Pigmentiphaga sp. NML080357]OVZ55906.1 type II secretion protein F [Pigmentiphaga sp. NML080357]
MSTQLLTAASLVLFAAAALLVGVAILIRGSRQSRSRQVVDSAITARANSVLEDALAKAASPSKQGRMSAMFDSAAQLGEKWERGRLGNYLLEAEDRLLIDRCGFSDQGRARALYIFSRAVLAVIVPILAWFFGSGGFMGTVLSLFVGFALGYMVPKWVLRRLAASRTRKASEELPLLIDLLRLLQGVGLSIDQSLHVIVTEFRTVLPVLAAELEIAVNQYARGLSREQSLQRLATGFGNEELTAVARMIVQVDKHGGAVQEPLKQFSERVREQRRMELKERVGKLTVKMTGVMVLTLLPALIIVTGGAGFLAVFRGLARLGG